MKRLMPIILAAVLAIAAVSGTADARKALYSEQCPAAGLHMPWRRCSVGEFPCSYLPLPRRALVRPDQSRTVHVPQHG